MFLRLSPPQCRERMTGEEEEEEDQAGGWGDRSEKSGQLSSFKPVTPWSGVSYFPAGGWSLSE